MKHIVLSFILIATLFCSCGNNGRSSESRQARLDGRVVTDEGEAKACDNSKAAYPDVNWKDGKLLNRVSEKELKAWIGK